MNICILKGINSESIDINDYPIVKQCYQNLIKALIEKGFEEKDIKIYFDDENRQIHFHYYPDELEVLICYVNFEDQLKLNLTQEPFSSGWIGNRYLLWHNKSVNEYLSEIKSLCELSNRLSQQATYSDTGLNLSISPCSSYLSVKQRKESLKTTFSELIKRDVKGIFFGEIHHHKFPKQFIENNLQYFKQLGIKTLFFEFLFYDRHQKLLDKYFQSSNDNLPRELAVYLHFKDQCSGCGFSGYTNIVKTAKKVGIRIVALDSYPSILSCISYFKNQYLKNDENFRVNSFNGFAAEIIKKESNDEPYLAFVGFDHSYIHKNSRYGNIKSIAELLPNTCSTFLTDNQISYKNFYSPFFSNGKALLFNYSGNHEAGAIVESIWNTEDCIL